jgi:hypothetical protein
MLHNEITIAVKPKPLERNLPMHPLQRALSSCCKNLSRRNELENL